MKFLKRITGRLVLDYSPFERINDHAQKVHDTTTELSQAFSKYIEGGKIDSDKISQLEHEADQIKQEIRNKLPRSDLLMPVARSDVLSFLWQQDQIADNCQDAAMMLSLLSIDLSASLSEGFTNLSESASKTASIYLQMVERSTQVLSSSLSSEQIGELWEVIDEVNRLEHQADQIEGELIKRIYRDRSLGAFQKYHLIQVVLKTDDAIDHMENAGEYLRIMTAR